MQPIYWLILMVVCLVIEVLTLGLTTIWFAGGALVAFLVALPGLPLAVQVGVFVAVSVLLLCFTRPIATRYVNSKTKKTNLDNLFGKTAVVTETIDNKVGKGRVLVDGADWRARALEEETIPEGEEVVVEEIQGVKLMVIRKQK